MSTGPDIDLSELRRLWSERRAALEVILRRFDTRGMTRPARDPEESRWLANHGGGAFIENESAAVKARAYYGRRYNR